MNTIRTAAILFIDAVDSVRISRILGPKRYDTEYLTPLQKCFRDMLYLHGIAAEHAGGTSLAQRPFPVPLHLGRDMWFQIQGDELCVVAIPPQDGLPAVVERLVWLGLETKLIWWQRPPNEAQPNYAKLFELGIGVHVGPVTVTSRPWKRPGKSGEPSPEGVALNEAKRVESASRHRECSAVMISDEARRVLEQAAVSTFFFQEDRVELKGMDPVRVHEVVAYDPGTTVITLERRNQLFNILMRRPFDMSANLAMIADLKDKDLDRRSCLADNVSRYLKRYQGLEEWFCQRGGNPSVLESVRKRRGTSSGQ